MPEPIWGTGNVEIAHTTQTTTERLLYARNQLHLDAVRLGGDERAYGRGPTDDPEYELERQIAKALVILQGAAPLGLKVLFQFRCENNEVSQVLEPPDALERIRHAGTRWVEAVVGAGLTGIVQGFALQNEFDLGVRAAFMNPPLGVDPLVHALAYADKHASIIRHFALGVRDRQSIWPEAVCLPGGMALPDQRWAEIALTPLVPDLLPGTGGSPPLLRRIALHWYFIRGEFIIVELDHVLPGPPYAATLIDPGDPNQEPKSLTEVKNLLLSALGLPLTIPIYVLELNVQRTTFGPLGDLTSIEHTKAALRAVANQLSGDPLVQGVFVYSAWPKNCDLIPPSQQCMDYLVSTDDPFTAAPGDPTPAGAVVLEYTTQGGASS